MEDNGPMTHTLQRCCFALLLAGGLASSLYARQVPPSESQLRPDDDPIHNFLTWLRRCGTGRVRQRGAA